MHQPKSSASCSAHSSISSAWTSSCERIIGLSEGDDDDELTWSPGSEPRQRRSTDQRSPIRPLSPGSGLYKRKTPDPTSISSYESEGVYSHKGRQAGPEGYGGANRNEEKLSMKEVLARNEAVDDGFSAKLLVSTGTSPLYAEAGAPHSLPNHLAEQEQIISLSTQRCGMTGSQFNGQVLHLASSSINPHSRDGTPSHTEFHREEDGPDEEETDIYSPPRLRVPRLPNDASEGRDHRIFDTQFQPECDLYQPIERLEDAIGHGTEIPDSSTHAGLCTIDHGCTHLSGKQDFTSSTAQFQSPNNYIHYSEDLYDDKPHEWNSLLMPRSRTSSDNLAFSGGIHRVHQLSPADLSVISPSYAPSGFHGSRLNAHDAPFPLCSACRQELNLQKHQVVHLPTLQQRCVSVCSARPVAANSPHQYHWFPSPHIQSPQRFPPQVVGIGYGCKEKEQLREAYVAPRRTKTRKSKRRPPPFPSQGAAPYVLCQHCAQLLRAPVCSPPTHATSLKLRCGCCLRVSKFGIQHSRKPRMAPRSFADGAGSSREASFHFPASGKYVSTVRSGSGEELSFAVHEVSKFWSTDWNGNSSSPSRGRDGGNTRPFDAHVVAPNKTLTGKSWNPGDANTNIPGREIISSFATSAGADTHRRVNVPQWDFLEVSRVTGLSPFNFATGILSEEKYASADDVRKSGAIGGFEIGNCVAPGASTFIHGSGVLSKDKQLSTDGVRKSAVTAGFGNGNCISPRNESQRQDAQIPISLTNGSQRSDSQEERCSPSLAETVIAIPERHGSPLYKLLGYKSPGDLRQYALTENFPHHGSSYDEYYSARVSDASNGSIAEVTFSPSTPDRDGNVGRNHQRALEVSSAIAECPELKQQGSVGPAHFNDNLYSGSRRPSVATKTLVKSELAAAKFSIGFFRRSLIGFAEKGAQFSGSSRQKLIVNGQVVSSAAIKKAEGRAGKLRPGCYWYDSKAGFWGVSGGPCIGILPPFIEDFNASMSRDCSKGTTNVLVNGRELRQEDLDKLARRGLPREINKVYSISFDGTVIDESSGETLKSLGKLAPTVERRGKGCGMFMAPSCKG